MSQYFYSQRNQKKPLLCKNRSCKSDDVRIEGSKSIPAIGATFRNLIIVCNKCRGRHTYLWTNDVVITEE